jgi:hypothetical protein
MNIKNEHNEENERSKSKSINSKVQSVNKRTYIMSPVDLCGFIILLCRTMLKLSNPMSTVNCQIIKS